MRSDKAIRAEWEKLGSAGNLGEGKGDTWVKWSANMQARTGAQVELTAKWTRLLAFATFALAVATVVLAVISR